RKHSVRRDAQAREITRLERGALIGAAVRWRNARVVFGQAAHMHLVDDVVFQRSSRLGVEAGGVGRRQHNPLGRFQPAVNRTITRAGCKNRGIAVVRIDRIVAELQRIGIEQQLGGRLETASIVATVWGVEAPLLVACRDAWVAAEARLGSGADESALIRWLETLVPPAPRT